MCSQSDIFCHIYKILNSWSWIFWSEKLTYLFWKSSYRNLSKLCKVYFFNSENRKALTNLMMQIFRNSKHQMSSLGFMKLSIWNMSFLLSISSVWNESPGSYREGCTNILFLNIFSKATKKLPVSLRQSEALVDQIRQKVLYILLGNQQEVTESRDHCSEKATLSAERWKAAKFLQIIIFWSLKC
jgi:hypothetical protein